MFLCRGGFLSYIKKIFGVEVDLSQEGHTVCPWCRKNGGDRNGDNMMVYGLDSDGKHKGSHCFKNDSHHIPDQVWMEENNEDFEEEEILGSEFNPEIHQKLKETTGLLSNGYRGIRDDVSKFFGVRYKYEESDGKTIKGTLYPVTQEYEISGYKQRTHPKNFKSPGPIGETGKDCDLFGQFRFRTFSNTLLIVGGEVDQLSAYQILLDAQKNKAFNPVAVVSPTVGESGGYKQVQAQYDFCNQFSKIIVALDNDQAGIEATDKMVKVLPRGKVQIMKMRYKDPNEYLVMNKSQEFINDFWAAKPYTPAGVHASTALYSAALERMDLKVISLPSFMGTASKMLGNGLVKKEITLILAKTSIGKTTLMSGFCRHLALYEQEEIVGVLSLEADAGKFSLNMLSYHLKTPLHRMSKEDRLEFLGRDDIKKQIDELYIKPDGTPTLYVCDDRGANWEQIKEKILEMIIQMGVTVLVIDPYSDLLSGMTVSEQEEVATWFKKIMKEYDITPIIVSHVRKGSTGVNAGPLSEDDAQGSSFLVKAAGQTLSLERDKQAESNIERNRTYINILKNRDFSETGPAGSMYFDIKTANLYDFEDYFNGQIE